MVIDTPPLTPPFCPILPIVIVVVGFVTGWQADDTITVPYAFMSMELFQAVDSYEIISAVEPFLLAEVLGSIGGFWGK